MKRTLFVGLAILLSVLSVGLVASPVFAVDHYRSAPTVDTSQYNRVSPHHACAQVTKARVARCHSIVEKLVAPPTPVKTGVKVGKVQPNASNPPGNASPYSPTNLHNAYNLPYNAPRAQTVAVVTAFDDPNAEYDLAIYRATFGLPACTISNGCFRKVNQNGQTSPLPAASASWALETALDLDMVSAICINCNILLVEANSSGLTDLGTAVNQAVTLGANVVSNSYGSNGEFASEQTFCNNYFTHPNVAIVASTGDNGLQVNVPATCPNVVAVGGTTLNSNGSETAWNGSGGGCSTYIAKPSWQGYQNTGCNNRAVADVSAVANPTTGVYVYNSYQGNGWYQMGGTSASAPIIAGIYGLAANANSIANPEYLPWVFDASGLNCINNVPTGSTISYAYQTGLGSPNGIGCF